MSAFRWSDHIKHGDSSDRPLASAVAEGALYASDDLAVLEQVVGGVWEVFADLSGTGGLDDSDISAVAPNDQSGTSYTLALADASRLVRCNNAGAITVTIPPASSVAYPLGTTLQVAQQGAGQVTVAPGSGVTLRTPHGAKTSAQYAIVAATLVAADEWYMSGDTTT